MKTVDFGYEQVTPTEKTARVRGVFDSVAGNYDLMNDLMSGGLHRLWKRFALSQTGLRPGQRALDVAAGTGDLGAGLARQVGTRGLAVLTDINREMLARGRDRLLDKGHGRHVAFVIANAERLPFPDRSFDCVTIGFGLRNVTDKPAALASMRRVLRPGGRLLVLEFSKPQSSRCAALRRLFVHRAAAARPPGRRRRGELSLPRRIDPHAPGPGDARGMMRRPGSTTAAGTTSPAASSRCTSATCTRPRMTPDLLRPFEDMLNRNIAASAARARCSTGSPAARSRSASRPRRCGCGWLRVRRAHHPACGRGSADAVIEGTPLSFVRLATGDAMQTIRAGGMDVRGDAEIAEGFQRLFEAARPDFEEELSRVTGDVAAHRLAGSPRCRWLRERARDTLARNVAEYLTEESRDLPVRLEVEEFLADVDRLREAIDRLDARIARPSARGGRVISRRVAGSLLTIHRVLVRYGLDDFVRATHLYRPLRFVFWLSP